MIPLALFVFIRIALCVLFGISYDVQVLKHVEGSVQMLDPRFGMSHLCLLCHLKAVKSETVKIIHSSIAVVV